MTKYKFYKNNPYNNDYTVMGILVEQPYDLLGLAIDDDRTSQFVGELIEGITKVKTAEIPTIAAEPSWCFGVCMWI
jgi:hypothetical protein